MRSFPWVAGGQGPAGNGLCAVGRVLHQRAGKSAPASKVKYPLIKTTARGQKQAAQCRLAWGGVGVGDGGDRARLCMCVSVCRLKRVRVFIHVKAKAGGGSALPRRLGAPTCRSLSWVFRPTDVALTFAGQRLDHSAGCLPLAGTFFLLFSSVMFTSSTRPGTFRFNTQLLLSWQDGTSAERWKARQRFARST